MIDRIQGVETGDASQAEEIKEKALDFVVTVRERLAEGGEAIKGFVIKEPARALGLALGLGVVVGWLLKRR
jgi:ElaB/YqjD/DUF883 family membrane-anchored ribosome-binding protein